MSAVAAPGGGADLPPLRWRVAVPADRPGLRRLGHAPLVALVLAPSAPMRLGWAATGLRAAALVAEVPAGGIAGSVHFVRSRRDRRTWMFGHWRVAAAWRRRGIGARLLEEGIRRIGPVERLYSYVDAGNEPSIAAHLRLGFEAGATLQGSVMLGALTTLGPPAPSVRLEPVERRGWPDLLALYAAAVGSLWFRLFPRAMTVEAMIADLAGAEAFRPLPRVLLVPGTRAYFIRPQGGGEAGFVVRDGSACALYVDPAACDAALLARTAARLLALGAGREETVLLRGLPAGILARPGPIAARLLMGMPDAARLARSGGGSGAA